MPPAIPGTSGSSASVPNHNHNKHLSRGAQILAEASRAFLISTLVHKGLAAQNQSCYRRNMRGVARSAIPGFISTGWLPNSAKNCSVIWPNLLATRYCPVSWLSEIPMIVELLPSPAVPRKFLNIIIDDSSSAARLNVRNFCKKSIISRSQSTTLPDQEPIESHNPPLTNEPLALPRAEYSICPPA